MAYEQDTEPTGGKVWGRRHVTDRETRVRFFLEVRRRGVEDVFGGGRRRDR